MFSPFMCLLIFISCPTWSWRSWMELRKWSSTCTRSSWRFLYDGGKAEARVCVCARVNVCISVCVCVWVSMSASMCNILFQQALVFWGRTTGVCVCVYRMWTGLYFRTTWSDTKPMGGCLSSVLRERLITPIWAKCKNNISSNKSHPGTS